MAKLSELLNILTSQSYDKTFTASAFVTEAHGLGQLPVSVSLLRQNGANWEPLDFGTYLSISDTQIIEDGLNALGAVTVRIVASNQAGGVYGAVASASQQGAVSTVAQTFAGVKTFDDGINLGDTNLSNYEQTTFSSAAVTTISANFDSTPTQSGVASCTRIGNRAFVEIIFTIDTSDGAWFNFTIANSNLPFTPADNLYIHGIGHRAGSEGSENMEGRVLGNNSSDIYFSGKSNSTNSGTWYFSFSYLI